MSDVREFTGKPTPPTTTANAAQTKLELTKALIARRSAVDVVLYLTQQASSHVLAIGDTVRDRDDQSILALSKASAEAILELLKALELAAMTDVRASHAWVAFETLMKKGRSHGLDARARRRISRVPVQRLRRSADPTDEKGGRPRAEARDLTTRRDDADARRERPPAS